MDLFTREIVGSNISRFHNAELVLGALEDAVKRAGQIPQFFHSDQGGEYDSVQHTGLCQKLHIQISMSKKGSPWENGFQESFYIENIHLELYKYNTTRRHSSLGNISPQIFHQNHNKKHPEGVHSTSH